MAVTLEGIDKAEVTQCVVLDARRSLDGSFVQTETVLPWAFVKFADGSEPNRYVVPTNGAAGGGLGLFAQGAQPYIQRKESMRNTAFPHENDRGPRPQDGDGAKAGPVGIHFFGPI